MVPTFRRNHYKEQPARSSQSEHTQMGVTLPTPKTTVRTNAKGANQDSIATKGKIIAKVQELNNTPCVTNADLTWLLKLCLREVDGMCGRRIVSASTGYKHLIKLCKQHNARPCVNCQSVLYSSCFRGVEHCCNRCFQSKTPEDTAAAKAEAQKAMVTALHSGQARRRASDVEDSFVAWLTPKLEAKGIKVRVMEEFRGADVLVRRDEWPVDQWMRMQIKSDSGLKTDGSPQPEAAPAQFAHMEGYNGMLVLCGLKRNDTYLTWCFRGDHIKCMKLSAVAAKNFRIPGLTSAATEADRFPRSIDEIVQCIDHSIFQLPTTTLAAASMGLKNKEQRKEAILMQCLKAAVDPNLTLPTGNSTSVDCWFHRLPTQVKTYGVKQAQASTDHFFNGVEHAAYDRHDFDQLVEVFLLRQPAEAGDRFFLFHAVQSTDQLVENGIMTDVQNEMYQYKTSIRPPIPPELRTWVFGRDRSSNASWMDDCDAGFKAPIEVVPNTLLTQALLQEVAHTSPMPTECPV
jgi:hypothetical protein